MLVYVIFLNEGAKLSVIDETVKKYSSKRECSFW